jgi:hypothetical protein
VSLTGNWNLSMKSPIGEQKAVLQLAEADGALSGTLGSNDGTTPLTDTVIEGLGVRFSAKIVKPMPLTLAFSGALAGDEITGEVKFGGFGAGPFKATRA